MVQTRSQWRASASRLSPELLRMIFALFCPHCRGDLEWPHWVGCCDVDEQRGQDCRSLFNLCLVSLSFRNAAQEIMYHTFDPRYSLSCQSGATWPWRSRLEPFLCTVASRPDLARSVKAVCLDPASTACLDFFASRDAFDQCAHALGTSAHDIWKQREHAYYQANPPSYGPEYMALFLKALDPGEWARRPSLSVLASELLTMLVALLPNLRHLSVDGTIEEFDLSPKTIGSLGLATLPLKTFDGNFRFDNLLGLAPNIETLITRGNNNHHWPNMPKVKSLVISTRAMDSSTIQRGVSACTGHLSNFSYRGTDVSAADIVQVLDTEELRATLRSIHIDRRYQVNPFYGQNWRPMPSFQSFTNLQKLFLTIHCIYGGAGSATSDSETLVNILPPSITSLALVDSDEAVPTACLREGLLGLAKKKPKHFKLLKWVRCDASEACGHDVNHAFEQVDVYLSYQEFPRPDWNEDPQVTLLNNLRFRDELEFVATMPLPDEDDDDDL